MDSYFYESLIGRLELRAHQNPVLFRCQVMMLSGAPHVVLFVSLCLLAGLLYLLWEWVQGRTGMLAQIFLLGLAAIPWLFAVLRMFSIRLTPPEGQALGRRQAPQLFSALDKMRKKLRAPPIHQVLIDASYNIGIIQRPRWGLFGRHINYMTLGLPYLLGTPPKEMLAAMAHEYGCIGAIRGKLGARVFRQRLTFGALYEQSSSGRDEGWLHRAFAGVMDRFMPHYLACTWVLARQLEYDADLAATRLVGAKTNASSLVRATLLGEWFDQKFWETIYRQTGSQCQPGIMPFASMRTVFKASYPEWANEEKLRQALAVESDVLDTRPALRARLEAIGEPPELPLLNSLSAADVLLGSDTTRQVIMDFDHAWWQREESDWQSRHSYIVRSKQRLKDLASQPLHRLAVQELQEYACLADEFDSPGAAKGILEHLLNQPGACPRAHYLYARILLDDNEERGLDHLATAIQSDSRLIEDAARTGYRYYYRLRGEAAAQAWWSQFIGQAG